MSGYRGTRTSFRNSFLASPMIVVLAVTGAFALDLLTAGALGGTIYVPAVCLSALLPGQRATRLTASACTLLAVAGATLAAPTDGMTAGLLGRLPEVLALWLVAYLCRRVQRGTASTVLRQRYERAASNGGVGLWEWDLVTGEVFWSGALRRLVGFVDDHRGLPVRRPFSLVHPEDRTRVQESLDALLRGGETHDAELRLQHCDGHYLWVRSVARLVHDEQGEAVGVSGTLVDVTMTKHIELALRESEGRFKHLFESNVIGINFASVNGWITQANDRFLDMLGYSQAELPLSWIELTRPGCEEVDEQILAEMLERGSSGIHEKVYRHRDGHDVPIRLGIAMIDGDSGSCLAFVQDITEEHAARCRLRESEEQLRSAFENASVGMAMTAPDGCLLKVNRALCAILGFTEGELTGRRLENITHPDDLEENLSQLAQLSAGEVRSFQVEKRYISKSGDIVWGLTGVALVRDQHGAPRHFIAQVQDITRRKLAEQSLRNAEAGAVESATRIRELYEVVARADCPISTQIAEALRVACKLFGANAGIVSRIEGTQYTVQHVHSPSGEIDAGQVFSLGDTYCAQTYQAGSVTFMDERTRPMWQHHPCYEKIPLRSYLGTVLDVDGERYGTISFSSFGPGDDRFHEVDCDFLSLIAQWVSTMLARQRSDERLERTVAELSRSNRELDQFAYVASHDLKAPLRAIRNLASWISEDNTEELSVDSHRHLEQMHKRVARMEALLDSLLAYSRVGRLEQAREQVDTGGLVRGVVDLLNIPETFDVELNCADTPVIETPRAPLELVLRNLVNNAVKHHDRAHGHIEIATNDLGPMVEFLIADDGPGIAPEFHDRVFGMFQTLRTRDDIEGSGMGLALVKKSVETHGGEIALESNGGRGAVFRVRWPKRAA